VETERDGRNVKRASFLRGTAAGGLAATASPARAAAQAPRAASAREGRKALVMSGGANRGAYQAGAIAALAHKNGLSDGQPLDYDFVCGTSIGALNAHFVATAQYTQLRDVWNVISTRDVFQPKRPYEKLGDVAAGVGNRLFSALSLAAGVVGKVKGIVDPYNVWQLLDEFVDPSAPVHLPLYISTTNLTRQRAEMFVRRATTPGGLARQALNERLLAAAAREPFATPIAVASDGILRRVLFGSSALPIVFDPVQVPRNDGSGKSDEFVDGGVTENIPIELARRCASHIDVLLVDPISDEREFKYTSALEVGLGVYATMQRRITEFQVELADAESRTDLPLSADVMRPADQLPGEFGDFSNLAALGASWQIGWDDGINGFSAIRRFVSD
jgi:predicted acylesterase/phospholipase RssA